MPIWHPHLAVFDGIAQQNAWLGHIIPPPMIGMLWRLRHVGTVALFLWILVLGAQRDAWAWVVLPLLTTAAVLVACEYLVRKDPGLGRWLVPKVIGLLFVYSAVFTGLPWLHLHFPETFGALQQRKRATDLQAADWIEPCLVSVQSAVRRYTQDLERTEAANIETELNRLLQHAAAGAGPDREREEAVRARIRGLAENREQWRSLLAVCDEAAAPVRQATQADGQTGSTGAKAPPAAGVPPRSPVSAPPPQNGTVPSHREDAPVRPVVYLTGPTSASRVLAIEPSTDPAVAAELNRTLKTELGSFTAAFFSDGVFTRLLNGEGAAFPSLGMPSTSVLFACRSSISVGKGHEVSADLRKADVRVTCRRFDARAGTHQVLDATGTGTGFSDQAAAQMGIERAAALIGEKLARL